MTDQENKNPKKRKVASSSESRNMRNNFSILEKLEILKELNNSRTLAAVADKHGLAESTLRGWKKNEAKLEKDKVDYVLTPEVKRIRISALDGMEEATYIWFDRCIKAGIPMEGKLIQEKALELHKEMEIKKSFSASNGWLTCWKKKYNIRGISVSGEKKSADVEAATTFKSQFEKTMNDELLLPCQIFNADETGLNYKKMPRKTLAEKVKNSKNEISGFKQNKERITIVPCTNANGSLKLPLVVIGRYAKPRAIKDSIGSLPVHYCSQKSAWMTFEIFKLWFFETFVPAVKAFLESEKLPPKAVLFVDNAACHFGSVKLIKDGIEVRALPANTTSILQPCDQGIIETLKKGYKFLFLRALLDAQKNGTDVVTFLKSINIKHVIDWSSTAWDNVSNVTIFKCWKKLLPEKYYTGKDSTNNSDNNESDITTEIVATAREVSGMQDIGRECVEEWIQSRDTEYHIPTNAELIDMISSQIEENALVENETDFESAELPPSPNEAILASELLLKFFKINGGATESDMAVLEKLKEVANSIADKS